MKNQFTNITRPFLRYLLTGALALAALSGMAHADVCGQLAGVRGTGVEILRMQRGRTAADYVRYAMKIDEKKTSPVECDDVILSGRDSSARVILANAKLSIGPESRIEIAAYSGAGSSEPVVSLLNLTYGKMRALVNRKPSAGAGSPSAVKGKAESAKTAKSANDNQVKFSIKTFSAVAGVRGTDFFVSYDPRAGLTEQATIEGSVEVKQAGTTQTVLVKGGEQVGVETTAAAVKIAQEKIKTGKSQTEIDLPKELPATSATVKTLKVVPMKDVVRNEIRVVSAAARDDKDFAHEKAIETLGKPDTWVLEREKVPDNLNGVKNEF